MKGLNLKRGIVAAALSGAALMPLATAAPAGAVIFECNTRNYMNSSHSMWFEDCTTHTSVGHWLQRTAIFNNHGSDVSVDSDFKLTIDGTDHNFSEWDGVNANGISGGQGITSIDSYHKHVYGDDILSSCTPGHQYKEWVRMRLRGGTWTGWASAGQFRC